MRPSPLRPTFALFATLLALPSCAPKSTATRTYPLGEKVALGHLVYAAYETQWLTQIGTGTEARVPQNRFLLVRASVTNSGGEPIACPAVTVVDDSGNSYSEVSDGEGVPQWMGYIRQIKPADTMQGNLVFDAPPRHYKLRVTDEDGQREETIDLPLEFTPESPDLAPAEKKKG